jgi:DNA ligase D-like protein (predicted 3'-phosphoesterase)
MTSSRFVVMKHEAKRAGLHYDLRFKIPGSKKWASFAVRKGIPLEPGVKVLAIRTEDHTEYGALFTGVMASGYGKGVLTRWDFGYCDVEKYTTTHIVLNFRGNKVKGLYHLLNTKYTLTNVSDSDKQQSYMLFKGKVIKETSDADIMGMNGRVPPYDTEEEEISDEEADKQQKKPLPWNKGGNNVVNKISIKEVQSLVELEEVSLLIDSEEMKNIHRNIMDFFSKNPSPKDEEIHSLANKLKIDPHSFEQHVYMILGSILGAGKSKDFKGSYDPEQIKMGIEVEKEHTTDPVIAERIAKDHLAEIPDYYTRLKQMESSAGVKD